MPVAVFLTSTEAPGMTPPWLSTTMPLSADTPPPPCARTEVAESRTRHSPATNSWNRGITSSSRVDRRTHLGGRTIRTAGVQTIIRRPLKVQPFGAASLTNGADGGRAGRQHCRPDVLAAGGVAVIGKNVFNM